MAWKTTPGWTLVVFVLIPSGIFGLICSCNNLSMCAESTCQTDGKCFRSLKYDNGVIRERLQCLTKEQLVPIFRPLICEYSKKTTQVYISGCCDDYDLCNLSLNLTLIPGPTPTLINSVQELTSIHVIIAVLGSLVFLLTTGCLVYLVGRSGRCKKVPLPCLKHYTEVETQSCETGVTSLQDVMNMSSTGSGSGLPILLQRTIARQIQLKECIGKGRFGEVQRGEWRGENVAVKIFSSVEELSWFREVEIYQTSMLRHDNILGFIAADNKDNGTWTQLWLVTQYMELGSLFDFLTKRHKPSLKGNGKPAIAHRDLKSKNILVRHDGVCAVGDLGLAVRYFSESNSIDVPSNSRVGTKRYLAPEVLDSSILDEDFESYKQGDIYALGLVFWEILNRVERGQGAPSYQEEGVSGYQPPYWDMVGIDPSIDEMRKVVCIDQCRPELPDIDVDESEIFEPLWKLMNECWYPEPKARLSVLRVKKSLSSLKESCAISSII
ncbi:TGF-beta receptor type-1 [Eurytemora carolleeae]|uniref:TGF-beta receptor type-1 n=1 Tax=Eurytemora carolleeae TaxID=1294199 RepID=UPI000C78F82E|nr:TGF-beta receptor type-1 [Eurytemora carolleeae]|eukprot:XP_023332900.1 TGF-beta receptor type-1-like [Eurytemora affinis]